MGRGFASLTKRLFGLAALTALAVFLSIREGPHEYSAAHFAYQKDRSAYTEILMPQSVEPIEEKVYGMIVSHHFYVQSLITRAFRQASLAPQTIVIIGPDHFGASKYNITLSKLPYETPFGLLEPDVNVIEQLDSGKSASIEEDPFIHEHSVSALVGIIKAVFPKTKIVPVILDRNTSKTELDNFAAALDKALPEDALVVASVDFSHHLNRFAAEFHDKKSIAAIRSFSFDDMAKLEIDSPPSIYALLRFLERRGAQRMIHSATNSALFSRNLKSEDVTSYLFAHFIQGKPEKTNVVSKLLVPEDFSDFEGIKGPEGNFLRGFDEIGKYSSVSIKDFGLSLPTNTGFLLGHLSNGGAISEYFIFPFAYRKHRAALLNYEETLDACSEIAKKLSALDYCKFYSPGTNDKSRGID